MQERSCVRRWIGLVSVTALGAVVFAAKAYPQTKEDDQPMISINAKDIGKRVTIIGHLGKPLGELVNVRGSWHDQRRRMGRRPLKAPKMLFVVTHVNGELLETHATFERVAVSHRGEKPPEPLHGVVLEMRGVERGRFMGLPAKVYREEFGLEGDGESPVADAYGFAFMTNFTSIKCRVVAEKE
jgi:hypothetical protein